MRTRDTDHAIIDLFAYLIVLSGAKDISFFLSITYPDRVSSISTRFDLYLSYVCVQWIVTVNSNDCNC